MSVARQPYVEDCDSDGRASPAPKQRPDAPVERPTQPAPASPKPAKPAANVKPASTGGESSPSRGASRSASNKPAPSSQTRSNPPTSVPASPSQSRPTVVQRSSSTRSGHQRTQTAPTSTTCPDPYHCREPDCMSARNTDRRYVVVDKPPASAPAQNGASKAPPTRPPLMTSMGPPPVPVPRQRAATASRAARPVSYHGPPAPMAHAYSYNAVHHGPPLSSSAYYAPSPTYGLPMPYPYANPMALPMNPYPSTPVPPSPITAGPPSATSARFANPNVAGFDTQRAIAIQQQAMLPSPTTRARGPDGALRQQRPSAGRKTSREYDSDSESSFTSSGSEDDDRQTRHHHGHRYRTERGSRSLSRRPEMPKSYTTDGNGMVRKSSVRDGRQGENRRYSRSDLDYPSDYIDPDRYMLVGVGRRPSNRSSRPPSISYTHSSGGTKSTNISSVSGQERIVVEDEHGRRMILTREEYDRLKGRVQVDEIVLRLREQDLRDRDTRDARRRDEDIENYQAERTGVKNDPLTAENVKRTLKRSSGSHISGSLRSHRSMGSKGSGGEGLIIRKGDTVLKVSGDQEVEIKPGEDGGPAQIIFSSTSTIAGAKDSGYQGSRSSGSRHGRSYVGTGVLRDRYEEYDDYPRGDGGRF